MFGPNGSFTYFHNGSLTATDSFVYVLADTDPGTPNVNVTVNLTIVAADAVAPAVTSVTVPAAGNYLVGQNLDFAVHFDENVYVDTMADTPSLAVTLDTGGTVQAPYVSGSGTTSLLFRMTVAGGQQDLNGIALGPVIALNGGTVRDLAANNAQLGLNSVPLTDNVLVAAPVAGVSVPLLGTWTTWALALMVAAGGLGVARRRRVRRGAAPFRAWRVLPKPCLTGKLRTATSSFGPASSRATRCSGWGARACERSPRGRQQVLRSCLRSRRAAGFHSCCNSAWTIPCA